jgi:4-diphosphocytidyl-2C-methyl-D-erythritol kinase
MKLKKYAIMTASGATVITANNKKEAATKMGCKLKEIYRYDN